MMSQIAWREVQILRGRTSPHCRVPITAYKAQITASSQEGIELPCTVSEYDLQRYAKSLCCGIQVLRSRSRPFWTGVGAASQVRLCL